MRNRIEILREYIDADVMQHGLHNMTTPIMEHEKTRFNNLMEEFGINH